MPIINPTFEDYKKALKIMKMPEDTVDDANSIDLQCLYKLEPENGEHIIPGVNAVAEHQWILTIKTNVKVLKDGTLKKLTHNC